MTSGSPPAGLTVRALRGGSGFALTLFIAAVLLHVVGSDVADRAATLGVLALIATPVLGLAATALESRVTDRVAALLAVVVIGVLAVAVGVALLISR